MLTWSQLWRWNNPLSSMNIGHAHEGLCFFIRQYLPKFYTPRGNSSCSHALIFSIIDCLVGFPLRKLIGEPSPGTDEGAHVSVSKYDSRALLPGTSEVSVPVTTPRNVAVKETESSIFCNAFPPLCCYNTQTLCNRFYGTSQVDGFSISKDEIVGALDVAVLEKMSAFIIT
ncbi:hypothetical protein V8G54_017229 [Vigna mungo]|uniref:Uncharacterized protein n=1 Tax=Vigna mungo TaxID=3915 RepID=A0AAQ3RYJ7_VIGMU